LYRYTQGRRLEHIDASATGAVKSPDKAVADKGFGLKISVAPEGCGDKSSASFKGSVLTFDEAGLYKLNFSCDW
jgi:hypothetical protein